MSMQKHIYMQGEDVAKCTETNTAIRDGKRSVLPPFSTVRSQKTWLCAARIVIAFLLYYDGLQPLSAVPKRLCCALTLLCSLFKDVVAIYFFCSILVQCLRFVRWQKFYHKTRCLLLSLSNDGQTTFFKEVAVAKACEQIFSADSVFGY